MEACVQRYIQGFADEDVDAIVALFADDPTVEDPLGSEPRRGHHAVRAFYEGAVASGAKPRLDGPVRTSNGTAAFPFSIARDPSGTVRLHIIDLFRFDDAGKIVSMTAIWS
jgi:steroid delta-isomerase